MCKTTAFVRHTHGSENLAGRDRTKHGNGIKVPMILSIKNLESRSIPSQALSKLKKPHAADHNRID